MGFPAIYSGGELALPNFRVVQRMQFAVVASGVVLTSLWVILLFWLFSLEVETRKQSLIHSAETIMKAADAEIARYKTAVSTMVASYVAKPTDILSLEQQAIATTRTLGDGWLLLANENGQQIFNTKASPDAPLPKRAGVALEANQRTCEAGTTQISDVGTGPVTQMPVLTVNQPVSIDGQCYVLAAVFPAGTFYKLMNNLPPHWLAGIVDSKGRYVTRSLDNDGSVGKTASAGWVRTMRISGIHEYKSREGIDLVTANIASDVSGWGSSVAVEKSALYAPFYRSIALTGIGGFAAITACLFFIASYGRRLASAVASARESAMRISDRHFVLEKTGEPDIDDIIEAHAVAAERIAKHDQRMQLATQEVNHRAKNLLAVISSFSRFIGRDAKDAEAYRERLDDRLRALSLSQDVLIANEWVGGSLREIVQSQVQPFAEKRVTISGDEQHVGADAVQSLCLLFHELATNASKHGSLSSETGTVTISWAQVSHTADVDVVKIHWSEQGPPREQPVIRRGFGSTVIEQSCRSLGGEPQFDYRPEGLAFSVKVTLRHS